MAEHFGAWLKRLRQRLQLTQPEFAELLGLEARESVGSIESRADVQMRGTTLEALLELLGVRDRADLDELWRENRMPDLEEIRRKLARRAPVDPRARPVTLAITITPELYERLLHEADGRSVEEFVVVTLAERFRK